MPSIDTELWDRLTKLRPTERGFDHGWAWWPVASLPPMDDPRWQSDRPVNQQDVQGTLKAISELSGFWVDSFSVDPRRREPAERAFMIACELEQMAASLRVKLEERLDQDDYEIGD